MTFRKVLAITAVVPLVAGIGAADAAVKKKKPPVKKPVCKIVQDAPDDATELIATTGPSDPGLDLVSADIASDATRVTFAWRVKSLAGDSTSWSYGRGFQIQFKTPSGVTNIMQAVVGPTGNLWQNGQGAGVVDTAKNEVRMTVPIASLNAKFKPNDKLTEIVATTWRTIGSTQYKAGRVDTGNSVLPHHYIATWPSCVKVGA